MTDLCGGGTSVPRNPAMASVVVDSNYMRSLLPGTLAWLYPFLPYMRALEIGSTATFCATDPPPLLSMPTGADFLAFTTNPWGGLHDAVTGFIERWVQQYLWQQLCMCSTGTAALPPAQPVAPADLPAYNPPSVVQPSPAEPCSVRDFTMHLSSALGYVYPGSVEHPGHVYPIPRTGSVNDYMDISHSMVFTSGPAITNLRIEAWWLNASGFPTAFTVHGVAPGGTTRIPYHATAENFYLTILAEPQENGRVAQHRFILRQYCNGTRPNSPIASDCCPPDPLIGVMLGRIEQLLTLVQRQAVPFATIDGDLHANLTGEGELAVQGLIGARIGLVDTLDGSVGVVAGNPETLFGTGWIRWGDSAGWRPREFLDSEVTLSYPLNAGALTRIAWSLPPGCAIDLVELSREP